MKKILMILIGVLFILVAATEGYCDKPYLVCSLYYDLSNITEGPHLISVVSCNLWGCSEAATIDFIKALPGKGKNVKIVVVKP